MTVPWEQAKALQRPLPDGSLDIVGRGVKKDGNGGKRIARRRGTDLAAEEQNDSPMASSNEGEGHANEARKSGIV